MFTEPNRLFHQTLQEARITVLFPVGRFDAVAELMKPRRRRVRNLTPEQRAEIGDRLRRAREGLSAIVQSDSEALETLSVG